MVDFLFGIISRCFLVKDTDRPLLCFKKFREQLVSPNNDHLRYTGVYKGSKGLATVQGVVVASYQWALEELTNIEKDCFCKFTTSTVAQTSFSLLLLGCTQIDTEKGRRINTAKQ